MRFMLAISVLFCSITADSQSYFPDRNETWPSHQNVSSVFISDSLTALLAFIDTSEYSGSRDLRIAILEGFRREPFHEILGPTKKRGGPAGLIIKDGHLITSWGDLEKVDMTFSVTKSYLSTVAGLAHQDGLIDDLHLPVVNWVWDGTFSGAHNSRVTWHHLLQQNSDWSGSLFDVKDWADRPPRSGNLDEWRFRELKDPGSSFEYNDVRVNVLAYSLLQVWRKPLPMVLRQKLMDPIGASSTWRWYGYDHAYTNIDGVQMQSVSGGGHSGGGVFINTLDQARFGYLFLNNGNWNGKQIISPLWITNATTPSVPNESYGYMWWLNKGPRAMDGAPETMFYAAGFGGNFIFVDRENDLLIVTRWLEPSKRADFIAKAYRALR